MFAACMYNNIKYMILFGLSCHMRRRLLIRTIGEFFIFFNICLERAYESNTYWMQHKVFYIDNNFPRFHHFTINFAHFYQSTWLCWVLTWFCLLLAQKNPIVAIKSTITACVSAFSFDFGPQYFNKMVITSKNCSDSDSRLRIDCIWKAGASKKREDRKTRENS